MWEGEGEGGSQIGSITYWEPHKCAFTSMLDKPRHYYVDPRVAARIQIALKNMCKQTSYRQTLMMYIYAESKTRVLILVCLFGIMQHNANFHATLTRLMQSNSFPHHYTSVFSGHLM